MNKVLRASYLLVLFLMMAGVTRAQVASFTASPLSGCVPLQVYFTNTSTGTVTSYSWNFGNTATSTLQNPSVSYTAPGTYTVSLTVNGPGGPNTITKTAYITVYARPTVSFAATTALAGCVPHVVSFSSTVTPNSPGTATYSWDFGDGYLGTGANPTHTYVTSGTYPVSLTVTNGAGCDTTIVRNAYITVYPKPSGGFSANQNAFCGAPATVTFTNTSAGGAGPYTTFWQFGDMSTGSGSPVSHTYSAGGTFTVTLSVTDSRGCVDAVIQPAYISVFQPPAVSFTFTNSTGCAPLTVPFTSSVTPSASVIYYWNFGDGGSSTSANPSHTYLTGGTYTVSVTVNYGGPCIKTVVQSNIITVYPAPAAPSVTTPITYCRNATAAQLSGTVGTGSTVKWYTSATGGTASTTAPTPGTTTVGRTSFWLSATNSAGCEGPRAQIDVDVLPIPAKPTTAANTPLCIGDTLFLTASTTATNPVYSWTGPGFSSALQNPFIAGTTTATAGTYRLTVSDSGCISAPDSVAVVITCLDSVWAGDANYDKLVDNTDALEIALTMGSTGPSRSATSINWQSVHSRDWATMLLGYPSINRKHADCDGDGTVTYGDTLAVLANYGQTHPKIIRATAKKTAGLPDLYFDLSGVTPMAGTTISIPIKLGTATTPVSNMAGIAARLMIDGVTPSDVPSLSYTASWLGGSGNTLHFSKAMSNGRLDWAYCRTDHSNNTGSGTLALLSFTIPDGTQGQQMKFYFDNVMLVDSNGDKITQFNILDDSVTILKNNTGISVSTTLLPRLMVLPNPSSGACHAQLNLPADGNYNLEVRDLIGKLIWQSSGKGKAGLQSIKLPAESLSSGIYLLSLHNEGQAALTVRWIKE